MKLNNFKSDLEYSLNERENKMFDNFYYRVFPGLVKIDFIEDMEMQKEGIDKILVFESGYEITVDEKKRRKDYGDILLEIWSVWEQRKRGWLYTCKCDYIVYAVMPTRKIYLLPVLLLKKAWLENCNVWQELYQEVSAINPGYITKSIAIPTNVLLPELSKQMEQVF